MPKTRHKNDDDDDDDDGDGDDDDDDDHDKKNGGGCIGTVHKNLPLVVLSYARTAV